MPEAPGLALPALARRRVPSRVVVGALALAAMMGLAGAALAASLAGREARVPLPLPELHGQLAWTAGQRLAPELELRDQQGRLVSLRALRGRPLLLTFLGTRCRPCQQMGPQLAWLLRRLPASLRPSLVVVGSSAAERPAGVRTTLRRWQARGWHWLLGDSARLARAASAYGIPTRAGTPRRLVLYLLDRSGFLRTAYTYPFLPAFVAADLRTLARERRR